jgi:FkbM family methyltransferase
MSLRSRTAIKIAKMLDLELDYRVEVECAGKDSLGSNKHWSWCICPEGISRSSIVYSLGVGTNISFDIAMIEKYQVQVYAFDPTPHSIEWVNSRTVPEHFHFFDYGIASFDGIATLYDHPQHRSQSILHRPKGKETGREVQFHTLRTVMETLGHEKIDILKMDIEGAEYEVLDNVLSSDIKVDQLLVEFHHNKFRDINVSATKKIIGELYKNNFRIFYVSARQREFSFIRIARNDG